MPSPKRSRLIVGALGLAAILWIATITQSANSLYRAPHDARPRRSARVQANLTQILNALFVYANENAVYPPRLSMLYPHFVSDPTVFWNPGDRDPRPRTINNDVPNGINSAQVSFNYFAPSADYPFVVLEDNSLANNNGAGVFAISAFGVHFFAPSESPLPFTATPRSNLEQIGAALHSYANAHGGHYPSALSALYPAYISDPTVFWNPGDNSLFATLPPTTIDNDQPNAPNSAQISYSYLGTGYTTASNPGVILVQDNSASNNGGAVLNILTAGLGVATYVPDVGCDDTSSCRLLAQNNLRGIGTSLYSYASENAGLFPDNLSMLYPWSICDPATFWNPGDTDPRPLFIDNDTPNATNSTQISFAYHGGGTDADPLAVVAHDNALENNDGDGLLVLTADSLSEFFEKSDRTAPAIEASRANLRQIVLALHAYAGANGGQFPANLSLLYPTYISDPNVFWSPGDRNPPPLTIDNDLPNKPDSAQISYFYLGAAYTSACPPGTILVMDNSLANNFGSGINVLTADGYADFYVPELPSCKPHHVCDGIAVSHLRNIGIAFFVYANENQGLLPPTLSALYPDSVPRPRDFWHPQDRNPWPLTIDNDVPNKPNSAQISFAYLAAGLNLFSLPSTHVLVRENTPSRTGDNQILELRADGSVYYVPAHDHHKVK